MTHWMSAGVRLAASSAANAAGIARSDVASSGAAMCRRFMPVRCTIHSSLVSTSFSRSSLVRSAGRRVRAHSADRDAVVHNARAGLAGRLGFIFLRDRDAIVVMTAVRAREVRPARLVALRTGGQRRCFGLPRRAPGPRIRFASFLFRIRHRLQFTPGSCINLAKPARRSST